MRLHPLDLERLHELASARADAFFVPGRVTWLVRAAKNDLVSEDREGFYLTEAQCEFWHF